MLIAANRSLFFSTVEQILKSSLLILLLLTGCSTLKKTLIYSGLSGALVGSMTGALLSPNKESQGANAAVFGLIGAGVAAMTGYALYKDDPRNYKLKNMLMPIEDKGNLEIPLGNITLGAHLEKLEKHKVPITKLPEKLVGKVNQQYLIKYQSKERYVKKGNKTFYIPAFEVYEHAYSELGESNE